MPIGADRDANVTISANPAPYNQGVQQAVRQTNVLVSALDEVSARLDGISKRAGRRLLQFSATDVASLGVVTGQAAAYEKQLSTLNATAAITPLRMSQVRAEITTLGQKFPETRNEAAQLMTVLSNLGVTGAKNLGDLAATFIKLGAATGESIPSLAQNLTQLSRQMGTTDATQIAKYANSLLTVSKNAGVSASGVLQFSQAIAPLAHQAGIGEAAVLGISTAFSKAGADGFPAVNAFNTMVQDITQSITNGSPDILKYANLIGKTADEFKRMDKTEAITEIFEALARKGPQAIELLNRMGQDGIRAQSAIAAVTAQGGGLRQAIADAQGSSHDTGNLNKAGNAAMSGLADNLVKLRTSFSQFAVDIGTSLLPAANLITKAFLHMTQSAEAVMRPFSGLIALLGAAVGLFSSLGGAALLASGLIAKVALGRFVVGSAPVQGVLAGIRAGRNPQSTNPSVIRAQAAYATPAGEPGAMRPYQAAMFRAGLGIGGIGRGGASDPRARIDQRTGATARLGLVGTARGPMLGPLEPPMYGPITAGQARVQRLRSLASPTALARGAIRGVGSAGAFLIGGQRDFLDNSNRNWLARRSPMIDSLTDAGQRAKARLGIGDKATNEANLARQAETRQIREVEKAARMAAASSLKGGSAVGELGAQARRTAWELSRLYGASGRAGASQLSALGGAAVRRAGSAAVSGVSRVAGGISSLFGGLPGMALMGGLAGYSFYQSYQNRVKTANDYSDSLDPVGKLNDKLGITTDKLAGFASGLSSATAGLSNTAATSQQWRDARTLSPSDRANTAAKYNTDLVPSLTRHDKNPADIAASISAMHLSDPKQLEAVKSDLKKALGADLAQQVLDLVGPPGGTGPGPDYLAIGRNAANTEDKRTTWHGITPTTQSKTGKDIYGNALTSIQGTVDNTEATYGKDNKAAVALAQIGKISSVLQLASGFDIIGAGGAAAFKSVVTSDQGFGPHVKADDLYGSDYQDIKDPAQRQEYLYRRLLKNKSFQDQLKQAGLSASDIRSGSLADLQSNVDTLTSRAQVGQVQALSRGARPGTLGFAMAGSDAFQNAIVHTGDENAQYQAQAAAFRAALTEAGGNLSKASRLLDVFGSSLDGASADIVSAARAFSRQEQANVAPTLSREGQLGQAVGNFDQTNAEPVGTLHREKNLIEDRQGMVSARNNYQAYLVSTIQMAQQYSTQMKDTAQDRTTSLARNERDFNRQMTYGEADYYKSRTRATAAFNLQMAQSDYDYAKSRRRNIAAFNLQMAQSEADHQKQVLRSNRDFGIQLGRQAQSSAEGIYNPFTRVQAEYTTDAGTLEQNLQDQNKRIADQLAQLKQARKMGLSQDSIDTLRLSDPGNAQQLTNIVDSIGQNPQLIARINKSVATRVKTTTALTQSSFSETFRNTVSDFNRSMRDTETDYAVSQRRARAAQSLALSQMAQDYSISRARASAAESLSMSQQAQDFETSRQRSILAQKTALDDQAADYKRMLDRSARDLNTAQQQITGTFGQVWSRAMTTISGSLKKYAPDAAKTIIAALDTVKAKYPSLFKDDPSGGMAADVGGQTIKGQAGTKTRRGAAYAYGGIATAPHIGLMGEAGAELNLPLGERGHAFMAGMYQAVGNQVAAQLRTAGRGLPTTVGVAGATTLNDYSTIFSGPITVQASDPNKMAKELANKVRIKKLARPPRATGGAL